MTAVNRNVQQRSGNKNAIRLAGWGGRIEVCLLQVQAARRERLSLDDFGALVAKRQRRAKPYKKSTVSQWIAETNEPPIAVFEAIGELAECDPWWIVWNEGRAPANAVDTVVAAAPKSPAKAAAR